LNADQHGFKALDPLSRVDPRQKMKKAREAGIRLRR
jgi:hypothetical protein